jgi:acyl-CoA hydrolase/ribosomal protein S18 acetylase RimI-like enzyme
MTPLRPSDWEKWIRPGSRVFVGSGAGCPHALLRQLIERAAGLKDIELVHIHTLGDAPWLAPALADTFSVNSFVASQEVRAAVRDGRADYTPCFLSEIPGLFLDGILPLDVALVQVSPPDPQGYCSLGVSVDVVSSAARAARAVIAQVNPRMPRTHGQSFIHQDAIDAFVEAEEDLPEVHSEAAGPEHATIGKYVAQLIEDGSTLRLGVGPLPDAVLAALAGHHDLGVHTDMLGEAFLPLLRSGVINNRRKTLHPGKTVTSFCLGSRALYDHVHDNPHVEFHPTEYVNNPLVIARNDHMVSITSALEIDLSGQVVADPFGNGFYSGFGGQVDFIRGATMSRGGIPIIALPSTTPDGSTSRILPFLREGAGVVTSRGDVHYVVTEFGIATLRGRSLRERALELIQIAHPRFREQLLKEAVEHGTLPTYQKTSPRPVSDLGDLEVRKLRLRGETFFLRPLHPSDIRRLQEFFYSHTLETIQMRYGYAVTRMTRERAYDLVNIDQSRDLALGLFEVQGPRQIIHAVGRYYLDPDGRSAEVAFVVRETKRRLGMASTLMSTMLAVARKRGLAQVWGRVRKDNLPMLALFKRFGGQVTPSPEAGASDVDVRISLQAAVVPPRDSSQRAGSPGSATKRAASRRPGAPRKPRAR